MRFFLFALCILIAHADPVVAQTAAPVAKAEAARSVCAALLPDRSRDAKAGDPFANLPVPEIERRLTLEAPRRVRELDLAALMRCLTAEMSARE